MSDHTKPGLGKLKPEFKERWCSMLESGQYSQCQSQMVKVEDGQISYCCLAIGTIAGGDAPNTMTVPSYQQTDKWWETAPSFAMSYNPKVVYDGTTRCLSELNDDYKLSFIDIAKLIREQL